MKFLLLRTGNFESDKKTLMADPSILPPLGLLYIGSILEQDGHDVEILDHYMEKLSKERYVSNYPKAMIYLGLGEKDQMFEYLEKAYEAREPVLALSSKVTPYFDSVRSDPKFKALLKRMGLE